MTNICMYDTEELPGNISIHPTRLNLQTFCTCFFSASDEERESIELSTFFESLAASDLFFLFSPTKYSETRQKLIKYSNSKLRSLWPLRLFLLKKCLWENTFTIFHTVGSCFEAFPDIRLPQAPWKNSVHFPFFVASHHIHQQSASSRVCF